MIPPTDRSAADYFGAMVAGYDSLIRRAVPRYDEMTDRLVDYLPPAAARVLELGCGTGNLTLRLVMTIPRVAHRSTAPPDMRQDLREVPPGRRARMAYSSLMSAVRRFPHKADSSNNTIILI